MVSRIALLFVAAAAVVAAGCEQVPLLAPSASTIAVTAGATSLAPGGSTTITASVVESGGTPVQNGTLVRFTATLGRVDPAAVETQGGVATTTFIAGTASGTAQIQATSGGATGGTGTPPTNVVSIQVGGAAATTVALSASSSTVPASGGSVVITATVLDASGNRASNVPVTFSTTAGTLSASVVTTTDTGQATVSLTTNRTATVTARVGSGEGTRTATVTITPSTASSIAISASPASVSPGQVVTATVTATAGTNATTPRVTVTWGDGTSTDLGSVSTTRAVTHTYTAAGTFMITAFATADGQTDTASTTVTVTAGPVGVNISDNRAGTPQRCQPVTFTAAVTPATETISAYEWEIRSGLDAENDNVTTTGNQLTRIFSRTGTKTIGVNAVTPDGRRGSGQTQIVVGGTGTEAC